MSLILNAARFAAEKHAGQTRKYNGAPYITHPIRVAGRIATMKDFEETDVAVGFLHDVSEDCGVTISEITERFGPFAGYGVQWLTNPSKNHRHLNRAERKQMDRDHIASAPHHICRIKAIDRIDNLLEMPASESFCRLYAEESRLLALAIRDKVEPELYAELLAAIRRMETAHELYLGMAREKEDLQLIDGETA